MRCHCNFMANTCKHLFSWVTRILMGMVDNCNLYISVVQEEDQEFKVILYKPGVCKILSQKK